MFAYTKAKFAKDIIKRAKHHKPNFIARYHESDSLVSLKRDGGNEDDDITINLNNLFNQCKKENKKERLTFIDGFLLPMLDPPELTDDQRIAQFRLRARTPEEIAYRSMGKLGSVQSPIVYGNNELVLELVEDSERHISLVDEDTLKKLSLSKDEAYKIAAASMSRELDGEEWVGRDELWVSLHQDDYDIARLLVAGGESRLPFNEGEAIAYAPSHSVCIISNSLNADSLQAMLNLGDDMAQTHRPLSKRFWTLTDQGHWRPLSANASADKSVVQIVKTQEIIESQSHYTDQKQGLDEDNEANLVDVFVANYVGYRNNDGDVQSMCTYTLHLPTLLPETDFVNVYNHETENVISTLPWRAFQSIVGDALKAEKVLIPPRYALLGPLSEDQIESLEQASTL